MIVRIHWMVRGIEDSMMLEGVSLDEILTQAVLEISKRGVDSGSEWSEVLEKY